ncbi:putative S-layer protein [Lactobacillus kimbladii]|uniref:Putative S-layer protein n=1 Tax=Lactobacillus kimbladii TaxID=1218506 RepID=A0A0F4LL46_9LACO|nr:SLAP domain-containing protein [Lactobacillus kimbladii]KJY58979.1 putative S-layer protein [Lactobacillus kimbladii]
MLGKNNNKERIRKMEMQAKQDHFSIRKLTIGAASVLLGFTFFGLSNQTVKADTVDPANEEVDPQTNGNETPKTEQAEDTAKTATTQKQSSQDNTKHDLSTFSGLSSFLRDSDSKASHSFATGQAESGKTAPESTNNSDQQPDADSTDKANKSAKPVDSTAAVAADANAAENTEINTRDAGVAKVHTFNQLITAFQNESVSEIDVMNDITDGPENGSQAFYFNGRKMLIKSAGNGNTRYKVDLKGNHLQLNSGSTQDLDITYDNLDLWSADIWGVIMTDDYNQDGHFSKITFNNVNFHGSQMVHCGNNTKIYFTGTNYGEVTHTPYPGITISSGDVQQLFEFTGSNNSIDFSGTFTGKTVGGNVIEMAGSNNVVNIEKDAKVTLAPRIYIPNNNLGSNAAEHTGLPLAIAMLGNNEAVNVDGELNIITGSDHYNGTNDNDQSSAILINDGNSVFNINSDAKVNITTNGDIANNWWNRNLIYDGGNFNILPRGSLNINGSNMGDYSGTLVLIKGTANIENGGFNIVLGQPDPSGKYVNGGTGQILLVDVQGGKLLVNNPTSLILNAQGNTNPNTSIIGTMPITLTNVRQQFDLSSTQSGVGKVTLPPFHVLTVRKTDSTIAVDNIELLNGQEKLTADRLAEIKAQAAKAHIALDKLPADVQNSLADGIKNGWNYDQIFLDIIQKAFNNSSNFGYNNISFIPANPSGFLDIDPGKVKITRNDDGSQTISGEPGSVINYNSAVDGPDSDPQNLKNPFSLILPVATKAYIIANLIDSMGKKNAWTPRDQNGKNLIDNPYVQTKDTVRDSSNSSLDPLPTQYAAIVNDDGSFSFTIPADQTINFDKGYSVELTPNANFVSYDPSSVATGRRPIIKNLDILTLADAQDQAAKAITDEISAAKINRPNNLSDAQVKEFNEQLDKIAAAASKTITSDNEKTSVYAPSSNTLTEINNRKNAALDAVKNIVNQAQNSSAIETSHNNAITNLNNEATLQSKRFPTMVDAINSARDKAINTVKSFQADKDITEAMKNGINAIDQAAYGYKKSIEIDLKQKIDQVYVDAYKLASDPNLSKEEKDEVVNLPKRLSRAQAIAQPEGDIERDLDQVSVDGHQKEAQGIIDQVNKTIQALKDLQAVAQDEIKNHADKTAEIKDSYNKAVHNIITGDDPDGSKGKESIKNINADQEASKISAAAAAAKKRVQDSGISLDQQVPLLDAIDQAAEVATAKPGSSKYDEQKSIYGTSDNTAINQREAAAQTIFDQNAAKAEIMGYATTTENSLGIPSNSEIEKTVADGLTNIDHASDSAAVATTEESTKRLILRQLSKIKLAKVENDIESQLRSLPGLSADDIDDSVAAAQKLLNNSTTPFGYNQLIDQADSLTAIDSTRNDGIAALNNLQLSAKAKGERNQSLDDAIKQIRQEQTNADKEIDQTNNLTDEQKKAYHDQISKVVTDSIDTLNKVDSSKITETVTNAKNSIDNIVSDAQGTANKEVEEARTKAAQDVDTAVTDAKAKIESIDDSQLSPSNKKYYEDQIDQDAQAAKAKIASAQNVSDITSAKQDGQNNILKDLGAAQITATRAQAISKLQQAKANAKNTLANSHLNPATIQAKQDQIDAGYDQAIQAITNDHTVTDINDDAQKGIDAINSVINSLSPDLEAQALEKQRQSAIGKLKDMRDSANSQITNDPNLGVTEKNDYYNQITNAFNQAQTAIQGAGKDDIDAALTKGQNDLTSIQTAANLQSAKDQALTALMDERNKVKEQIGNMDQITSANKDELRAKVDATYDIGVNGINDKSTTTNEQLNAIVQNGKSLIDNVISDINVNKILNKQKLDDYAQKAIDRINNSSDITNDAKTTAINNITSARDNAKSVVDSTADISDANTAEKNGESAIDAAEAAGNGFNTSKTDTKNSIANAATSAKNRLNDIYSKLSEDQRNEVKKQFNDAISQLGSIPGDANSKIDAATNKDQLTGIYQDALNKINKIESAAKLASDKVVAIDLIKQTASAARAKLPDSRDQNAVFAVADLGIKDIGAANDSATVEKIKNNTLQGISNVVANASKSDAEDIRKQRDQAIKELDKALGKDSTDSGVLPEINGLTGLTTDQLAKFKKQANDAYDHAVSSVSGALSENIDTEKNTGLSNIYQALSDAKLQAAKNKAKSALDDKAQTSIDGDAKDKSTIESERDKAKENIDKAQNQDDVQKAQNEGNNAINAIVDTANDEKITNAKTSAKNDFDNSTNKLQQQIDQDLADKKLGQDQYNDLKNKIDQIRQSGETRINSATSQDKLADAKGQNNADLDKVNNEIVKAESVNNALTKLQDAVNKANEAADKIAKDNPSLADQMRERIKSERDKAAENVQTAQNNATDANSAMNQAAQAGSDAITGLTQRFEEKNKQINTLKDYAEAAKAKLPSLGLDSTEISQNETAINDAMQKGVSDLYGADDNTNLGQVEKAGEAAIDQAGIPANLLSEKNKQIAAIDKFVKDKGNINQVASDLTDQQKADLQDQLNQLVQKTKDEISKVALPNSPTTTDLDNAKQKLQNIEKGLDSEGHATNLGEAGINQLYQTAQNKEEIYQIKQNAINNLLGQKAEADKKLESSGLVNSDLQKQKQKLQDIYDQNKAKINAVSTTDKNGKDRSAADIQKDVDQIVNNATQGYSDSESGSHIPGFTDVEKDTALAAAKAKAEDILQSKYAKAHNIIGLSQLTGEQKKALNKIVDDLYANEKASIEQQTDITKIPTDENQIGTKITDTYQNISEWFDYNQANALKGSGNEITGLEAGYNGLTEEQKANPDYQSNIQAIREAIAAIKHSTNIDSTTQSYSNGINAYNELMGKERVNDMFNKAKNKLNEIDSLVPQDRDHFKNRLDGIHGSVNTVLTQDAQADASYESIANQINHDIDMTRQAIDQLMQQALYTVKSSANGDIETEYKGAVAQNQKYFGDSAWIYSTNSEHDKYKVISGNSYDEVLNNRITGIRKIAQAAVSDAATNAKKKIDNNRVKHENGDNYTDDEKAKIKTEIDRILADAQEKINQNNTLTDIDGKRDDGIEAINKASSDSAVIDKIIKDSANNDNNGNDSGSNGNSSGSNGDNSGSNGNNTGNSGNDSGSNGNSSGNSGNDSGSNGNSSGSNGNNTGDSGNNSGSNGNNTGDSGNNSGSNGNNTGNSGNDSGSNSNSTGNSGNDSGSNGNSSGNSGNDSGSNGNSSGSNGDNTGDSGNNSGSNGNSSGSNGNNTGSNGNNNNSNSGGDNSNSADNSSTSSSPANPVNPAEQPTTDKENGKNDAPNDLGESTNVTLMHNAYLYDDSGKRANKVTLAAGSILTTYGTITIAGREYYVLVDTHDSNKKYYVDAANGQATKQKVVHNAYIYNQLGKRVKNTGLYKKGQLLNTYGGIVKIRGKKYFIISKNRFVKAGNVKLVTASGAAGEETAAAIINTADQPVITTTKKLMHNAYLYDESGKRANKLIINLGSELETVGKKTISGKTYYALADGLFVDSGNIDAKRLKLKHNAYIYNKYGHRLGKKILRKHKAVQTYGNPVKIGHKKYFIIAKGRYIKKANF